MELDFTKYTIKQLFESLESVNDRLYPENAVEIYINILTKLNTDEIDIKENGYEDNITDDYILSEIIGSPLTMLLLGDYWNMTHELEEKIDRIKMLVEERKY